MSTAWLGIGSNINTQTHIRAAHKELDQKFGKVAYSPAYRSKAIGFDGDDFINLVARIDTPMSPLELRQYLRDLEDCYGRKRDVPKFSDRSLDIDILLYDDLILRSPVLEIPRAEILKFAHVLKPLADLDPNLIHPQQRRTMEVIWASSGLDGSGLQRLDI